MVSRILKILTLDRKIREQSTGTAEELACALEISRSKLFEVMDELKNLGADIRFDRYRKTYYYFNEVDMNFTIKVDGKRVLTNDDMSKISAGSTFFVKSDFNPYSWTVPNYITLRYHNLLW